MTRKNINTVIDKLFFLICPFLLLGIYLEYTNFILCLIFIFLRLITTDKDTAGVFLILFGGLLGGVTRHVYPSIPIYGLIVAAIGLVLLLKNIRTFIYKGKKSICFLIIVFFIFFIAYLYGPKHSYSNNKLIGLISNGLLFLFAYFVINTSHKFSNIAISQLLLLTTISYFVAAIESYGYGKPSGFFDYTWYRISSSHFSFDNKSDYISYQRVGMNALYGFAFFIAYNHERGGARRIFKFIFYATCLQLILLSGARQAIFGLAILLFLKISFFSEAHSYAKKTITIILGVTTLYLFVIFIDNLGIDFLSTVLDRQGDIYSITGRGENFTRAFQIISKYPLWGLGLGGYSPENMSIYPHNIILEILCECGIIGLTALLIVTLMFFKNNKLSLRHMTANGTYLILILVCVFVRAFVSSDLTESIALFSGIFAMGIRVQSFLIVNNSVSTKQAIQR